MDLTTKRGHLTIKLQVHGENCKVMLRSGQETKTWFDMIMVNTKPRRILGVILRNFSHVVTNPWPVTFSLSIGRTSPYHPPDQSPYSDGSWAGQLWVSFWIDNLDIVQAIVTL